MGTGSYIGFQISQIFHSGIRAGGSMKEDSDSKGDRSGGWIGGILVFLFVGICRALLAVVLIPLHTLVALCQTGQKSADVVTRIITLCLIVAGVGFAVYEIQHASRWQVQQVQPSQPTGFTQPSLPKRRKLPKHKLVSSMPVAGMQSTADIPTSCNIGQSMGSEPNSVLYSVPPNCTFGIPGYHLGTCATPCLLNIAPYKPGQGRVTQDLIVTAENGSVEALGPEAYRVRGEIYFRLNRLYDTLVLVQVSIKPT
jgi:hypothetical protein